MSESHGKRRGVLIIVENLPLPFDRRVWQEAKALNEAGYLVSIVCPTGVGYEARREDIDGIAIYRHSLPVEAAGVGGYLIEYGVALFWQFRLALRVLRERGYDAIHACNPPDLIFLVGGFFKLFAGKRFLFDHHDICPELYEAKFGRRGFMYRVMLLLERWTFRVADVSIATNESYRRVAIDRGRMPPERVFVVRTGPNLDRLRIVAPNPALRKGRRHLIGYVGTMGKQEGIDLLLESMAYIVYQRGRQDIHLGLVGGGSSLDELRQRAQELRLSDYVTFTGRIGDGELLEMLNTADVCVNPDVANDMNDKSTMIKIMEYMALGKPIVQFDLTEGRFSAQGASLYAKKNDPIDMAEKLLELLDDPERCRVMGRLGRERVTSELEWRYEVPKLLDAYRALFEDARVAAGGQATRRSRES